MKILFVTPFFSPSVGGVQQYVQNLVSGYAREHELVIITSLLPGTAAHEELDGVRIYRLKGLISLSNTPLNPLWFWQIRKIIHEEKPDIIDAHSPVPFMADVALYAAKGYPTVLTYHAGSMLKGSGLVDVLLGAYERIILPRVLRRARKVIAIYPAFIKTKLADQSKIVFIPPGINTNLFQPLPEAQKKFDLIFAGRLEKTSAWKGLTVLLESVALLAKTTPHISLNVVGDGDARANYQALCEQKGITSNVTFSGNQTAAALVHSYNQARIAILPSLTEAESFGMVLAEAMACGVPVIGSRIGGIPTVIDEGKTGLLVTPNDPDSLASAITSLLADESLQKSFGEAGRRRVNEAFSIQNQRAATLELFRSLADD